MKRLIFYLPVILAISVLGIFGFLRSRLQDDSVPVIKDFQNEKVMFIFPHPDDEIMTARTLKLLDRQNCETILLTLTHGEAGDTNGLIDTTDLVQKKIQLGQLRKQELLAVGELLGIDHLEIFDFPDSGIQDVSPDVIKKLIKEKISEYRPTILITYDDRVGLYGHLDHVLTARYTKEIFLQERDRPNFPIKKLYQVTLPKPMIETALQISDTFRRNYPKQSENGLPEPTIAVKISQFGRSKKQAMLLHRSQRPTFNEMQPYFDRLPPFIYFRIFDKEYFTEVGANGYSSVHSRP